MGETGAADRCVQPSIERYFAIEFAGIMGVPSEETREQR